ncbi:MAG: hypothetical protein JWM87_165 [Candidatus Eremiobacteraeota bacterium]|nr:hypothetical protein [Candidatus Eremiobacteraeota bacterium]
MLRSRFATAVATLCLALATASNALAQVPPCDCSRSSLMGTTVGTLLNSNFSGPVYKTVTTGVELPAAGPTLGAAGPAPRWNIDFAANSVRIDFLQQPATYGATSKFTFSSLAPVAPRGCPGRAYVSGISVVTNKANAPYVQNATFTANSVVVPFAPTANGVDWYPGEYIIVTLKFACKSDATPTPAPTVSPTTAPFDPCCPPWNSTALQNSMVYQGSGPISGPYTLKFQPSAATNSQILAYLNYLHAINPAITSINIQFQLWSGNNGSVFGPPATQVGTNQSATWIWPSTFPAPNLFFASNAMIPNMWYRIQTQISLNGNLNGHFTYFGDKCAFNYVDVRIQVSPSARVLQTRFPDGRTLERRINVTNRAE